MILLLAGLTPVLAGVLLCLLSTKLGRALPPASAVPLLTSAALATALATGFVLAVVAFDTLAAFPAVAAMGHWSQSYLRHDDPLPPLVGVFAGVVVIPLLLAAVCRAARTLRSLASAALVCRRLPPGAGGLVVLDSPEPDAYALPGLRGRVVVSSAMLQSLSRDERRVLLAHEAAHLHHRHHLYVQVAALAAAANPLLRPAAAAVRAGVERWADEVAATDVGDRHLAARALARAALVRHSYATGPAQPAEIALAADGGDVPTRTRALLAAPVPRSHRVAAALAALAVLTTGSSAAMARHTEKQFENARALYQLPSPASADAWSADLAGLVRGAKAKVLGVVDGLVEQGGDVVVIQAVGDAAPVPLPFDQA